MNGSLKEKLGQIGMGVLVSMVSFLKQQSTNGSFCFDLVNWRHLQSVKCNQSNKKLLSCFWYSFTIQIMYQ